MKKNVCKQNFIKAVALIATLAYGLAASAATYTWNPTTQGVWSTADGYWSPAPLVSANTNDVVMKTRFLTAIGLAYTIRSLTFDNGGNSQTFNLNNSNAGNTGRTLTFESDSGNSTLTVNATATGNYTIQSLTGGRGRILLTSSLDIVHNGSGTLSLGGELPMPIFQVPAASASRAAASWSSMVATPTPGRPRSRPER